MGHGVRRLVAFGALGALAASGGCSSQNAAICQAPQGSDAAAQALAKADTTFAVAFYPPASKAAGDGSNVILSPYSVTAVMAMLDAGAAGETASQIQSVLALPGSGTAEAPAYAALACGDESNGSADGNQLTVVNSLWGQKGMKYEARFLSTLATGYMAPFQQVDFMGDVAGATDAIDKWVSTETQGLITDLFQPGDLDVSTRLVVVNAIYFKGTWADGFDPNQTTPQPFTLSDGSVVDVPTMSATVTVSEGSGKGFSLAEIPYQGGKMALDVLLPDFDVGLAKLETSLTASDLATVLGHLSVVQGALLELPKFSFKTRVDLGPVLSGMGMTDAFLPTKADLSGIDGAHDLYVSKVVQEATVEVDEQGTVASAATGGSAGADSLDELAVDRPFLFLIRDTITGSVLFMGRVEDPRQGS
jgi:serpin B